MNLYGIRRIRTCPYNPRANGEIERRWRTLKNFLRRNTKNMNDLRVLLPRAVFMINNVPNATTMHLPSYLMYGYTPAIVTTFPLHNHFNPNNSVVQ